MFLKRCLGHNYINPVKAITLADSNAPASSQLGVHPELRSINDSFMLGRQDLQAKEGVWAMSMQLIHRVNAVNRIGDTNLTSLQVTCLQERVYLISQ